MRLGTYRFVCAYFRKAIIVVDPHQEGMSGMKTSELCVWKAKSIKRTVAILLVSAFLSTWSWALFFHIQLECCSPNDQSFCARVNSEQSVILPQDKTAHGHDSSSCPACLFLMAAGSYCLFAVGSVEFPEYVSQAFPNGWQVPLAFNISPTNPRAPPA